MPVPDPRYPIGPAPQTRTLTPEQRRVHLAQLAALPDELAAAVAGLNDAQLDSPYRAGGWTLRQVAHHIADSHLNAYLRTKLALTEDHPTVKTYDENAWAALPDSRLPVAPSLDIVRGVHGRWAALLESPSESDWQKTYLHPENGETSLDRVLSHYVWHGQHHTAQILNLREERGW